MIRSSLIFTLAVLGATDVQAADTNGSFGADGIGGQPCSAFTEAADKRDRVLIAAYAGWAGGFITSYNALTPDTYDVTPWQTGELILAKLDKHCRAFPEKPFVEALGTLVSILHKDRLTEASPLVQVSAGGKGIPMPRAVLARVRSVIEADRGSPITTPEGEFDQAFAIAITAYQTKKGVAQTGLPDQATLNAMFP